MHVFSKQTKWSFSDGFYITLTCCLKQESNIKIYLYYYYRVVYKKTRKNAIVEYLDYQIPVTQLNREMHKLPGDNSRKAGKIPIMK